MADHHFAGRARDDICILLVNGANLDPRNGPSKRARADRTRRLVIEEDAHHLGHAPRFDQRKSEALLECRVQLRLDAEADAEAYSVAALLAARLPPEQQRHDDAEI